MVEARLNNIEVKALEVAYDGWLQSNSFKKLKQDPQTNAMDINQAVWVEFRDWAVVKNNAGPKAVEVLKKTEGSGEAAKALEQKRAATTKDIIEHPEFTLETAAKWIKKKYDEFRAATPNVDVSKGLQQFEDWVKTQSGDVGTLFDAAKNKITGSGRQLLSVISSTIENPSGVVDKAKGLFSSTGGTVGAIGGAIGGFMLGSAIGNFIFGGIPFLGPIIGFMIGLIGAGIGLMAGAALGNGISNSLSPSGPSPALLQGVQPAIAQGYSAVLSQKGVKNANDLSKKIAHYYNDPNFFKLTPEQAAEKISKEIGPIVDKDGKPVDITDFIKTMHVQFVQGIKLAEDLKNFIKETAERAKKGGTFTVAEAVSNAIANDNKKHMFAIDKQGKVFTLPESDQANPMSGVETATKFGIEAAAYGKAIIMGEFKEGAFKGKMKIIAEKDKSYNPVDIDITLPLKNGKLDFSTPEVQDALKKAAREKPKKQRDDAPSLEVKLPAEQKEEQTNASTDPNAKVKELGAAYKAGKYNDITVDGAPLALGGPKQKGGLTPAT